MTHIIKFNELNINTYRSAAHALRSFNKGKRADDLDDWADKKDFGYYKAMFGNKSGVIGSGTLSIFTKPSLIGIYTSNSHKNIINDSNDSCIEDMVNSWSKNECELSLKFEFGFKAISTTKQKHSNLRNNTVPLFSIKLLLCGYVEDYSEYDEDRINIRNIYNELGVEYFYLAKPKDDTYFGILSDRASAFRFIKFLKTIVDKEIKDKIMEVLSIIGVDTSDLNRILGSFNEIRTHGLYSNDLDVKNWYNLQIN